jgi:hypothetical protein
LETILYLKFNTFYKKAYLGNWKGYLNMQGERNVFGKNNTVLFGG